MGLSRRRSSSVRRETIYLGRNQQQLVEGEKVDAKQKWQMFWRKINREKKKMFFSAHSPLQASYDPDEYSRNFDHGTGCTEPDNLSRSFSARFADPSRSLQRNSSLRCVGRA